MSDISLTSESLKNQTLLSCGGNMTEEYMEVWNKWIFWCEGVLTVVVGTIGFIGNLFTIAVLLTKEMRQHSFNLLLVSLAFFDLTFIICGVPVHAISALEIEFLIRITQTSECYGYLYQYVLYPFTTISYCGSVYMTVAITIERFIAVCRPFRYREFIISTTPVKRCLIYMGPVVFFSVVLNIHKFLELEVEMKNGTLSFEMADFRVDPTYVWWYTHSFAFHPFLTTTIAPICILCCLNYLIYRGIQQAQTNLSSSNSSHGETNLALVFIIICLLFLVTHILRMFLAVEAVLRASQMSACLVKESGYIPPLPLMCMESVSHLLILTNSACNFLIYCTMSTHFKIFMKKLFSTRTNHTLSYSAPNANGYSNPFGEDQNFLGMSRIQGRNNDASEYQHENIPLKPLQPRKAIIVSPIAASGKATSIGVLKKSNSVGPITEECNTLTQHQ